MLTDYDERSQFYKKESEWLVLTPSKVKVHLVGDMQKWQIAFEQCASKVESRIKNNWFVDFTKLVHAVNQFTSTEEPQTQLQGIKTRATVTAQNMRGVCADLKPVCFEILRWF